MQNNDQREIWMIESYNNEEKNVYWTKIFDNNFFWEEH